MGYMESEASAGLLHASSLCLKADPLIDNLKRLPPEPLIALDALPAVGQVGGQHLQLLEVALF
jgi:hypothetical protein